MVPAAGEALEHFAFVVPESATAEEGKKETRSLLDVPVVPAVKVPGQGPGWMGPWGEVGWKRITVEGQ